jgi:predicted ATP-grasp superfamily ATP-dependent carboligase
MAAIRGLTRCGARVIGADDRRLPFNRRSRYLQNCYRLPPVSDERDFLRALLAIVQSERPDVLFPIAGTYLIVEQAAIFEAYTRILLPPPESYRVANNNHGTLDACRALGIDCPRLFKHHSAVRYLREGADRRLVVKPRRDVGAGRGVHFIDNHNSLNDAQKKIETQWGECVIQEYIPGRTGNMRTVNLLFDRPGHLATYFTTRKIRQFPTTGGITALSISTHETELVANVLPFFKKFNWKGLAEVELKIDDRDGRAKVIEINPRVWGYLGFPIHCGVNFPLLYCRAAMGRSLPPDGPGKYRRGVKYLNPLAYMKAVIASWRGPGGKIGWRDLLKDELRGPLVVNHGDRRDAPVIMAKMLFEAMAVLTAIASRQGRNA